MIPSNPPSTGSIQVERYEGDGNATRTFSVPFRPSFVIHVVQYGVGNNDQINYYCRDGASVDMWYTPASAGSSNIIKSGIPNGSFSENSFTLEAYNEVGDLGYLLIFGGDN